MKISSGGGTGGQPLSSAYAISIPGHGCFRVTVVCAFQVMSVVLEVAQNELAKNHSSRDQEKKKAETISEDNT